MPKKNRKLVVIGKLKAFDEDAWKRLLTAYAYYLHEQRNQATGSRPPEEERQTGGRS